MNKIESFREKISNIDKEIVELLIQRFQYAYIIGDEKKKKNIPILNNDAYKLALSKYKNGLGEYGEDIFNLIHKISVKIQENVTDNL